MEYLKTFNIYHLFASISDFFSEYPEAVWCFLGVCVLLYIFGFFKQARIAFSKWNSERIFRQQHASLIPNYEGTYLFTN